MQMESSRFGMLEWWKEGIYSTKIINRSQFDSGPYSANSVAIDKSGVLLAVASDDQSVKLYNDQT